MRILHLSSLYPPYVIGGAEKVVATLANCQAKSGLDVVVTHLAPTLDAPSMRDGVAICPLPTRNLLWITNSADYPSPIRILNKLVTVFNMRTAKAFADLLERTRPDIVHTHSMVELPPMIWRIAVRNGASVVHTLHDYDLLCVRGALFKNGRRCDPRHAGCRVLSAVKRQYHNSIGSVVAISNQMMDRHLEEGLFSTVPDRRRHVIWNPVDAAINSSDARPSGQRGGEIIFGFLGRLVPEKGIDILLQACRFLPARGWRLKIGGAPGPDLERMRLAAAGCPVEFSGFVDPNAFLRDIDVLIAPSIWEEPFGLTVVEAYAAGRPVIGARSGGIAELVGAFNSDWLVPAGDARALASRMQRVLQETRAALPKADRFAGVLDQVRPDYVTHKYRQVYDELLTAA